MFLEKSRTMMCSWVVSGWCAHYAFTHPAVGVIFQSQDKDRAQNDIDYVRCLWERSRPELKERWPLAKSLNLQPNDMLQLENGSWLLAIPGNPDKIRSAHPTIVVLDEAAHIEKGQESFDVAAGTRCLHQIALSSAKPGWFREATEFANPVDWPSCDEQNTYAGGGKVVVPGPGMMLRRTDKGVAVVTVHYSADPDLSPEALEKIRKKFTSKANWDLEMEIKYDAHSGQLVYPEFDPNIHVIPHDRIPKKGCRFMAIDPHPRTPHAFLWILVDPWDDFYVYRELWPSIGYGRAHNVKDDEEEWSWTISEYAETVAVQEGSSLEWRNAETSNEYAVYRPGQHSEKIIDRYMDQAGKGFMVGEEKKEVSMADRYRTYDIVCRDPIKSHKTGEDAIRDLLRPRRHDIYGTWPKLHISDKCPELKLEFLKHRYRKFTGDSASKELRQEGVEARTHMLDLLRYLATGDLFYSQKSAS